MASSTALFGLLAVLIVAIVAGAVYALRRSPRRRANRAATTNSSLDYAPRSNWSQSKGKLNYSSFVFFDRDRDGGYGVGDAPMAGIMVRLAGERGLITSARTNAAGFGNFPISIAKRKAAISSPGRYEFRVSVPPGWIATGDNAVQARDFLAIPGSPAGIGTEAMLQPVGLAPERIVRLRLVSEAGWIAAHREGRQLDRAEISHGSPFQYRVPDEAQSVTVSAGDVEWRLAPVGFPVDLGAIDPTRGTPHADRAIETIDFDGITSRGLRKIPSGYAGLNWFNLNAMARDYTPGSQGYINGNTSGAHIAYTSSGHPAELWSDTPFDFISVALSGAWLKAEGETATIESWRGDELISRDRIVLSALAPVYYTPMLPDITRIRFSTGHYWQMVIDDLTIARSKAQH